MKLLSIVKLLEGKSNEERTETVECLLNRFSIPYTREFFDNGVNIIVTKKGRSRKQILAVCHTDVVPGSPGANDDASAIAVLIEVLRKLKKFTPHHTLKIIFFDKEEPVLSGGCEGSRAYVNRHGINNLLAVINLELVGRGEVVAIWPVIKKVQKGSLVPIVHTICKKQHIPFEDAGKLPMFMADYLPFHGAGFYNAICLTLVPQKERAAVRRFAKSSVFGMVTGFIHGLPEFFKHYHSKYDTSSYLREKDMQKMVKLVVGILKEVDLA